MEFTKELKYYTLFIALVALFGVFFKAMENPNRAMAICSPSELGIGETCDYRLPTPTPLLAEGHQEELVFENNIQKEIYKVFGKEYKLAYAIARAESGLNTEKCFISDREYSCGIFQINLRAHDLKVPGETIEEKADWLREPANNIITAKFIRATSGWRAWSVFTNESYKKFL
jgi:hypothetical protein